MPFTAHFWRHYIPDTDEFDTLDQALAFAQVGQEYNEHYVEKITDDSGRVLYARDTDDPGAQLLPVEP